MDSKTDFTSACACAVHEFYRPSTVKIRTPNISPLYIFSIVIIIIIYYYYFIFIFYLPMKGKAFCHVIPGLFGNISKSGDI